MMHFAMMKNTPSILFAFILLGVLACRKGETFLPKPRGFHRIELPKQAYQSLPDRYPYTFEVSEHSKVQPDTSFMAEPHWIEIYYPDLGCTINVSYKDVMGSRDSLIAYFNASHKLTNKHHVKASAIHDFITETPNGDVAILFELEGDVPSQFQYFITDSTKHFLRAALYFPMSTKNDSLAPVIDYVKEDMLHMMNTTRWK